jgi:type I restriction enzyme S subunit
MSRDLAVTLERPEPSVSSDTWEIPPSWTWRPLGDVAEILDHRRVPINSKERAVRCAGKHISELFPYYGATGQVGWIDGFLFEGDHILLGEDGAPFLDRTKPKAYLASGRYWVNNHAHILKSRPGIELRWLLHALNWADYEEFVGGTTRLKLTQADLIKIPIPIAPLPEQRRIVARIDELFAEIEEGEAALERARHGLDTWRRALLKAAVTGELTRDWRERKHIIDNHADNKTGAGDDLADIRMPFAIPSGWTWRSIGEVGEVRLGRQRAPKYHSGPDMRHYLRVANVLEDKLDLSDVKTMNFTSEEVGRYRLVIGDILLNEGQALDLVGRSAIYHGEIENCCFQNTLKALCFCFR